MVGKLAIIFAWAGIIAFGQTISLENQVRSRINALTPPATCTAGRLYINTVGTLYVCIAPNSWIARSLVWPADVNANGFDLTDVDALDANTLTLAGSITGATTINASGLATLGSISALVSTGTTAYGLRIADNGGTFTQPLTIHSARTAASTVELINQASGTGVAPNQIRFSRATTSHQGLIESDIVTAGSFASGYMDFYTRTSDALSKKMRLGAVGGLTITPLAAASLSSLDNNTFFICTDCTVPACGGGGGTAIGFKDNAGSLKCF